MLPDEGTGSSFPHGHVFRKKKKNRKKERKKHPSKRPKFEISDVILQNLAGIEVLPHQQQQ